MLRSFAELHLDLMDHHFLPGEDRAAFRVGDDLAVDAAADLLSMRLRRIAGRLRNGRFLYFVEAGRGRSGSARDDALGLLLGQIAARGIKSQCYG